MPLLDSSYLIARTYQRDALHADARRVDGDLSARHDGDPLIVIDYVFTETVTVVAARQGAEEAIAYGEELLTSDEFTWVHASDRLPEVWRAYVRYARHGLSVTDAALVAVAREFKEPEIVTFDTGFGKVEGIQVIP